MKTISSRSCEGIFLRGYTFDLELKCGPSNWSLFIFISGYRSSGCENKSHETI